MMSVHVCCVAQLEVINCFSSAADCMLQCGNCLLLLALSWLYVKNLNVKVSNLTLMKSQRCKVDTACSCCHTFVIQVLMVDESASKVWAYHYWFTMERTHKQHNHSCGGTLCKLDFITNMPDHSDWPLKMREVKLLHYNIDMNKKRHSCLNECSIRFGVKERGNSTRTQNANSTARGEHINVNHCISKQNTVGKQGILTERTCIVLVTMIKLKELVILQQ